MGGGVINARNTNYFSINMLFFLLFYHNFAGPT